MTDIMMAWLTDPATGSQGGQLVVAGGDLATDDSLRTAVNISLGTNRRARDDDALPADLGGGPADRGGWWGDLLVDDDAPPGDLIGSRLWLLAREKLTPATQRRAEAMCSEALDWMIQTRVAASVEVATLRARNAGGSGVIEVAIRITRAVGQSSAGTASRVFDMEWAVTTGASA